MNDALAQQQDSAAAMLYRLMFRHERNINVLDRYADQVLDGVCGMGSSFAEEDYMNYLQYLKVVVCPKPIAQKVNWLSELNIT